MSDGATPTFPVRGWLTRRYSRERMLLLGFLLPLLVFFTVVWFIPIVYAFVISLFTGLNQNMVFVGLQNYADVLARPSFWTALWNGTVYAIGTTVLSLILGLGLALVVNQRIRGGAVIRTMMILPYLIPMIVGIFIWKFMLNPNVGIINQMLQQLGLIAEPIAFYSKLGLAMASVVVVSVWKFASFAFFILLARLQAIDDSLYERARIEGATPWQGFRDITLPNLRATILIIVLVRGIWMFNKFDIIWLSTRGGPLNATTTLPILVYEIAFFESKFNLATALAGIMFVLLAVVAVVYFTVFSPDKEVTGS